jgi:LuxR family maltose regulon positive regulatory protein
LEQAFYITQNENANRLIRRLYDNNCFLKYNSDVDKYTFHSIFKQALIEEVENININLEQVYINCAEWCTQNKDIESALAYYFKAKKYDKILRIIENAWMTKCFDLKPEFISLILKKIKEEHKINNPIGFLIVVYNCLVNVDQTYGKELLQETKKLYEIQVDLKNKEYLLGEIMLMESYFCNDIDLRLKNLKKAYCYFNGRKSYILNSETPFSLRHENSIKFYHHKKGELKETVKLLGENICCFINTSNGGCFGQEYLVRAEFEYEIGNIESAELFAYKALYKAKSKNQTSILIDAYFLIMCIQINKKNTDEVDKLIKMLEQELRYIQSPILITRSELTIAYVKALMGIENDIPSWASEYDVTKHKLILADYNSLYIVSGIYMILRKSYIELEVLAENMINENKKNRNIFGQIYGYILEAIAKYNIYGIERAKMSYFKALIIGREDNIVMPFLELAPYSMFMVNHLNFNNEYLQRVVNMIKNYLGTNKKISKDSAIKYLSFDLTEREIEVMELICSGYKQVDIGNTLHISLNTVRYHSKNIYDKLEVSNKALAIQKYNNEYRINK